MSDNKFILQLKGTQTPKSVVEIKNDKLVAPFVNVPGSSDVVGSIIPDKDSSVVVAKGAENWQLDGGALVPATNLTGDGADFTGEYAVSGNGLWVNAVYTFPSTGDPAHPVAEIFNAQTKWVLQLCGKNLHTGNGNTIDFSFIVKIGSSHIMTKAVTVSEQANFFCKRFVLDFSESEQSIIKASGGSNLTVQLLCADDSASATIYNGMTILTALQRRIDASEVSAPFANVEEVLRDGMLPSDYFSNAEFIDEVGDGEQAYAVFERDGDNINLAGWTSKDDIATTTQLNDEITARENADLGLQDQIDDLKGLGRFLSVWNCATGLAETNPPESPYTYNSGDYFLVGTVGATNYKPNGATYTTGVASTTVETGSVQVNDVYIYDGTTWQLQENSQRTVIFSGIQGSPYDNTALSNALNSKIDETSSTNQVYGTDNNGDQTTYNITDFGAVDDVKVNNVSVVTSKIANIDLTNYVTLSTTQAITGTKTFKAEILSWNNITFESAQANPIIRGMSGASYRNMVARTNSASAIDVGNTSDKINLKGSGTRPTYNSNDLAMYSDIPAAQVNSDWNANSGVAEILNKPTLGTAAAADTTDFATAAQGALADTALQSGNNVSELANDAGYLVMSDLTGFVTRTTAQTISGLKTFTADIALSGTTSIKNTTSGVSYTMLYRDTSGIHVGTSTQALLLAGSGTRPTFNGNNVAMSADIPTVNNPTITITQGGVTKGSFTLNQASGDTIALDAGGGGSYHPDLFDYKWADHICNDTSWLRADTFSWQSGAVYQAAYQHLADDIDGKTLQSETVGGTTIQFYLADDGHKICPASQESNVLAIYNATGVAWYYIIDTTNQRFKLPRRHSQQIVRSVKNADGSWYRLYADGWVEQGGVSGGLNTVVTLPAEMADTNYTLVCSGVYEPRTNTNLANWSGTSGNRTSTTTITLGNSVGFDTMGWRVSGQSAIDMSSFQDGEKYLYFYVGTFTQTAIENTAGLNTELFNGKVDLNLNNVSSVGKDVAVGWNIPDYSAGIVVASDIADFTERTYTAPADGVIAVYLAGFNGQDAYIKINDVTVERVVGYGSAAWVDITGLYPVKNGSVIKFKDGYAQATLIGSKRVTFYPFTK